MLQSACAEMKEKEGRDNSETTSAIHKKELQEKGKHSFPYINSMKSGLSACVNYCLKVI